ncbi:MAG: hypothetical protein CME61_08580 [Halobacteriovoraceae bacterium]|nr:hypothetical protein [Halobacteriovoraceae bacterium]
MKCTYEARYGTRNNFIGPMTNNLNFGVDADANHALAILRASELDQSAVSDEPIVPGVFLSFDPESGTTGQIRSNANRLLNFTGQAARPARWLSLNIKLGACDLSQSSIFGFVCKTRSDVTMSFNACLRSGLGDGFSDVFFGKRIVSFNQPSTHVDLFKLDERDDIPLKANWRELLLFFPTELEQIDLVDLRLFVV